MSAANTLAFNADHMEIWSSDPTEDDQIIVNDVTVTQTSDSSSAHQIADTGQPVDGGQLGVTAIGRYDQTYTVNVTDPGLNDNAGWRLHMGTVNEPRYPGIAIDLANFTLATAGFILPLLDMDLGDRLIVTAVTSLPWLPPGLAGQVDQVMNGVTETLWQARVLGQAWQGIPYTPWPVGIVADTVYGRADTDGSTVNTGISSSATSMLVTSANTAKPLWTTAAGDFPFAIQVNYGEVMTVTNITSTTSPQTFTVTRGVNGVAVAHSAGEDVRLAYPMIISPS